MFYVRVKCWRLYVFIATNRGSDLLNIYTEFNCFLDQSLLPNFDGMMMPGSGKITQTQVVDMWEWNAVY